MARFSIACVVVALCSIGAAENAAAISSITGSELLRWCEDSEQGSKDWFVCHAYLNGVLDGQIGRRMLDERLDLTSTICVPDGVDPTLMKKIFVAYANQHLNVLAFPAVVSVIGALDEQYPCP